MTTPFQIGSAPCPCQHEDLRPRLIALTGGPGAGKTAVLEMAVRSLCNHVAILPEAAGIVFGGGFPRLPSHSSRRAAQRAIYHVQRELEYLAIEQSSLEIALCDRGTIDGLAYWPDTLNSYWQQLGTSLEEQLGHYSAVIHLRTPRIDQGYNRDNELRVESAAEAQAIDDRILEAWQDHPQRFIVESEDDFLHKAMQALQHIRLQLPNCCQQHLRCHTSTF